jgi:hypothetical protein
MIVSKSRSQATLLEERSGRLTSCKTGDSVLYHSRCCSMISLQPLGVIGLGWLGAASWKQSGRKRSPIWMIG